MSKIVFLSSLFSSNLKNEIEQYSKKEIQYAAHTLQWNITRGLIENTIEPIKVLTAPLTGSFPFFYRKINISEDQIILNGKIIGKSLPYFNIPFFKNLFIKKALIKELKSWVKKNPSEEKIIVVYSMLGPWVLAAIKIKNKFPGVKLCLIVPDLPKYMSNSKSAIFKFREYFLPDLYPYIPLFDAFVFLTDKMAEHFKVKERPWVTVEGMINPNEVSIVPKEHDAEKKIILYTGTIAERYGILDLLEAFKEIKDPCFELWICGSGNTESHIKACASADNRVKYFGLLPREKVLELQRRATVLVNPRTSEGEFTKYSFPSKTMEYLLSGTPVIMKPLPGIPEDYHQYIFFVQGNGKENFKNKIIEVCSLSTNDLREFGARAQNFVLEKKNYLVQTKKILSILEKL